MKRSSFTIWTVFGLVFLIQAAAAMDDPYNGNDSENISGRLIGITDGQDWAIIGKDVNLNIDIGNGTSKIAFPAILIEQYNNTTTIEAVMELVPAQNLEKMLLRLTNGNYLVVDVNEYESGGNITAFRGDVTTIITVRSCYICMDA